MPVRLVCRRINIGRMAEGFSWAIFAMHEKIRALDFGDDAMELDKRQDKTDG